MGSRMHRDRSKDGGWWLMLGLFTLCVVGWSLAFSLKAGATDRAHAALGGSADRSWSVASFDRIRISGSLDVVLEQGDVEAVLGRGAEEDLDRLDVYVERGELVIEPKKSFFRWGWKDMGDVRLLVRLRALDSVAMSGSGDLSANGIAGEELRLTVSGSSDIRIEGLQTAEFDVQISGSADVEVDGSAAKQSVRISGSADYDGSKLSSSDVEINVSGSGDARVQAEETLVASVSGSGSVRFSGSPQVDSRVAGSGSVAAAR